MLETKAARCWNCAAPIIPDARLDDRCAACYVPQFHGDAPALVNLGDEWPWPKASDPRSWFESNRKHYWHSLEVLPPRYVPGGFFVSEPWTHDARGVAICALWACIGSEGDCSDASRYFVRHVARDGHAAAMAELRALLAGEGAAVTR